ncbi:hypothetical protein BURKHO8Y_30310 [Burkholderia sp. 8Y]|nr:hypothetical protein BURKHO8Y_30310 [Burkholderia sp. 8Y]
MFACDFTLFGAKKARANVCFPSRRGALVLDYGAAAARLKGWTGLWSIFCSWDAGCAIGDNDAFLPPLRP